MATSAHPQHSGECPECSGNLTSNATETTCTSCGLVVEDSPIDHGPEWRAFTQRERNEKARADPSNRDLNDRGLGSQITRTRGDRQHGRLQVLHQRAKGSKKDRNRGYATTEIQRIASALELSSSLTKQAKNLFRQLHTEGLVKGRDLDTLAATALYTTARMNKRGLTPADFEDVSRTDARTIARRHRDVCNDLDVPSPPPNVKQRIRVVAREAGVSEGARERALARFDDLDEYEQCRGAPSTLAAALLYEEGRVSQATIADAAGRTPAALRNRLETLNE